MQKSLTNFASNVGRVGSSLGMAFPGANSGNTGWWPSSFGQPNGSDRTNCFPQPGQGNFGTFGVEGMNGSDQLQQQMFGTAMNMMQMCMMMMMSQMSGQQGMFGGSNFGGQGGSQSGSPINDFLGGGGGGGGGGPSAYGPQAGGGGGGGGGYAPQAGGGGGAAPSGASAGSPNGGAAPANGYSDPGPAPALPSGPAGKVGNIDVEKIVSVLDPQYQDSARQHFPGIVAEAQKQGVTNKAQLAYILATTVHESNAGKSMEEFADGSAYEGRGDLGNNQAGDGKRFKGRGYVQVTGRNNYKDWSNKLGVDLVGNPQLATRPDLAAKILVGGMKTGSFTGVKLDDFINNQGTDFNGARKIVNGTDKAGHIAGIAQRIMGAMS